MGGYFYTTKEGDMWDYIAWKVYGSESYMETLLQAKENLDLIEEYIFPAGASVWCPYVEEGEIDDTPEWTQDTEGESEDEEWRDDE